MWQVFGQRSALIWSLSPLSAEPIPNIIDESRPLGVQTYDCLKKESHQNFENFIFKNAIKIDFSEKLMVRTKVGDRNFRKTFNEKNT